MFSIIYLWCGPPGAPGAMDLAKHALGAWRFVMEIQKVSDEQFIKSLFVIASRYKKLFEFLKDSNQISNFRNTPFVGKRIAADD